MRDRLQKLSLPLGEGWGEGSLMEYPTKQRHDDNCYASLETRPSGLPPKESAPLMAEWPAAYKILVDTIPA